MNDFRFRLGIYLAVLHALVAFIGVVSTGLGTDRQSLSLFEVFVVVIDYPSFVFAQALGFLLSLISEHYLGLDYGLQFHQGGRVFYCLFLVFSSFQWFAVGWLTAMWLAFWEPELFGAKVRRRDCDKD